MSIDNNQSQLIKIWLRDTYSQIHPTPIYDIEGFDPSISRSRIYPNDNLIYLLDNLKIHADKYSDDIFYPDSDLFLNSSDIFGYLNKNIKHGVCDAYIIIVINNLRDIYWNNRHLLPQEELPALELSTEKYLPTFVNIFDYQALNEYATSISTPIYQLYGDISPYNVVNIPVKYFIESINTNQSIKVKISDINTTIELNYEPYDFWSFANESIVNYIDINKACK